MGVMQNVTENINVGKLLDNWDETHELTKDEALAILNCDDVCLDKLIETAYALRLKYKGKKVSFLLMSEVVTVHRIVLTVPSRVSPRLR